MKKTEGKEEELNPKVYDEAIKKFTKYTIQDPTFFLLSPEKQKEKALEFVQRCKKNNADKE